MGTAKSTMELDLIITQVSLVCSKMFGEEQSLCATAVIIMNAILESTVPKSTGVLPTNDITDEVILLTSTFIKEYPEVEPVQLLKYIDTVFDYLIITPPTMAAYFLLTELYRDTAKKVYGYDSAMWVYPTNKRVTESLTNW